jgi:hypothetical protein
MSSSGSVAYWIRELQAGNHQAAQKLWEKYFHRLVVLAFPTEEPAAARGG